MRVNVYDSQGPLRIYANGRATLWLDPSGCIRVSGGRGVLSHPIDASSTECLMVHTRFGVPGTRDGVVVRDGARWIFCVAPRLLIMFVMWRRQIPVQRVNVTYWTAKRVAAGVGAAAPSRPLVAVDLLRCSAYIAVRLLVASICIALLAGVASHAATAQSALLVGLKVGTVLGALWLFGSAVVVASVHRSIIRNSV